MKASIQRGELTSTLPATDSIKSSLFLLDFLVFAEALVFPGSPNLSYSFLYFIKSSSLWTIINSFGPPVQRNFEDGRRQGTPQVHPFR